jgi:hypothetical protein
MKPQYLAMVAVVVAALVGLAKAAESTRVYRQGHSTATITQDDDRSSPTTRRVIRRGPNSQTIIQQQGGNRAVIIQN